MAGDGLPEAAREVLRALSVLPGATPGRLVEMTGRSWNAVDASLRRLEDAGHAERRGGAWFLRDQGAADAPGFRLPVGVLRLLEAVERTPGVDAGEAARDAGLDPADVSRFGRTLEGAGWLARVRLERRVHYVPREAPDAPSPEDEAPAPGSLPPTDPSVA